MLKQLNITFSSEDVNMTTNLPHMQDAHDCKARHREDNKLRGALHASLLQEAQHIYLKDGCCYKTVTAENTASYTVRELINNNHVTVEAGIIPQPASAPLAEIVGLTGVLELLEGRTENIITDSAYAHATFHVGGPMWVKRDFKTTAGATVKHCEALTRPIKAMHLPIEVTVVKCRGHKKTKAGSCRGTMQQAWPQRKKQVHDAAEKERQRRRKNREIGGVNDSTETWILEMQEKASPEEKSQWKHNAATKVGGV